MIWYAPVLCRVRALTHPDLSLIGALLIRRSASLRGVVVGEAGRPAEGRSSKNIKEEKYG